MIFHQFVDCVFQCPGYELVFQGDGEHDQLIIIARFEFCHRFLYLVDKYTEPFGLLLLISPFFDRFNGPRYLLVGVGKGSEAGKRQSVETA